MLGYFSLVGLLRLHSLLGDYYQALKVLENVDFNKKVCGQIVDLFVIPARKVHQNCQNIKKESCLYVFLLIFSKKNLDPIDDGVVPFVL